ncbi:MAG TPA: methyltransferase domain-containing protein [Blastocatellia bacterium]|nr:methyltransferase domain-containing protein [Blastocatellia bacterium]
MNNKRARHPYQGASQIFQYNWPFYAAALLLSAAGIVLLLMVDFPWWLRVILVATIFVAIFWSITSLAVSHYVYDRSGLYQFHWLPQLLPQPPAVWINIHAGLDETSALLMQQFPDTQGQILDIYDPAQMTEPAIKRARHLTPAELPSVPADFRALPVAAQSCDVAFVIFAAHELRTDAARLSFFRELQRVLRPQGNVVLVEHQRDVANFIAFGPGAWHFLPRSIWLRTARAANFNMTQELKLTPFVRAFCLSKS